MTTLSEPCRAARRALLAREDDPLAAAEMDALTRHLEACAACRARAAELERTLGALRTLPAALPFPDDALEALFDRTVRAPRPSRPAPLPVRRTRAAAWRVALAAGVLLAAVLGPYLAFRARGGADAPSPAGGPASASAVAQLGPEERRAAQDLRFVLQLADRAVQRSQRAAVDGVLRRGVDPALRRVPLLRRVVPDPSPSGDGSGEAIR